MVGGMSFERWCSETLANVKLFHPDAVFINLGGNSINPETEPSKLAEKLCEIVQDLKTNGAKTVYVGEIAERGKFKNKNLDKKCFDGQRTTKSSERNWALTLLYFEI